MKKFLKFFIGGVLVLFVIGWIFGEDPNRNAAPGLSQPRSPSQASGMTAEQIAAQQEARRQRDELLQQPSSQSQFVAAVQSGIANFRAAGRDEFAQGASRPARRQAICATALARSTAVRDWVGQVSTRTTNGEGRGVLAVTLAPDVTLKTWNNAISDIGDRTLVEPGSQVFNTMSILRNGDWVRFSGRFFQSDTDCLRESSLSIRGSMSSPEFIFRFEEIRRVDLP